MKKNLKSLLVALALLLSYLPQVKSQTPAYVQDFNNYLNNNLGNYGGNVVAIVGCRDRILYTYSSGFTLDSTLDVQSLSKWVTSAVIMKLVKENKIALDSTAGKYIPSWNQYGKQGITIRQLLAHTSGLNHNTPPWDDRAQITLAQAVDSIAQFEGLLFQPGQGFHYGSTSYKVVSRAAERQENKVWKDIYKERIADLCGMQNSRYSRRFPFSELNPLTGQGLECSANEYAHFLKMILNYGVYNGVRVMDSSSIEDMQAKSSNDGVVEYGLGQMRDNIVNGVAREFQHTGASGCLAWIDRVKGFYGVILSQSQSGVYPINDGFRFLVRDKISNTECSGPGPSPCDYNISASGPTGSVTVNTPISLTSNCTGQCTGVSYAWSGNGLSGSSANVGPFNAPGTAGNYTYTITASKGGCTAKTANVSVNVVNGGGSINQCLESELQNGTGAVTSDPNASNGSTRGEQNNYNHYVDYVVTSVPSAGSYTVALTYYSSSAPTIKVEVNGAGAQTINLPNSGSWNIVHTTQTFTVSLAAGNNTIRISGTGGGSCRQDKICVTGSGGGCSTPAAPGLSASPSTVAPGSPSTLTATGCTGGTITWTGLGTGTQKTVNPTTTTTYKATCTLNGCISSEASVVVTVENPGGTPFNQCLESELQTGTGTVTDDPNASNGHTRGEQNNYNHYVDYAITGVPSAGTYYVTLRYYSSAAPTVSVTVNGSGAQTINLANSGSWNIVWTTHQFSVSLPAGSSTLRISGTGGGSCRQDRICVSNSQGSPIVLEADEADALERKAFTVFPNPSKGAFTTDFYLEKGKKGTIIVSDMQGRAIYRQHITGQGLHRERIDLSGKASGMLLVQLQTDKGVQLQKINLAR